MHRRRFTLIVSAIAVLVAAVTAAVAMAGTAHHTARHAKPVSSSIATPGSVVAQTSLFRRARTSRDTLSSTTRAGIASATPSPGGSPLMSVTSTTSRRADPGTGRFGTWAVAATMTSRAGTTTPSMCAYTQIASGPHAGGGGENCLPDSAYASGGVGTVTSGGATGAPGFAPHEAVIAGVVPDAIRTVTLAFADGTTSAQPVVNNYYFFDTTNTTRSITYTGTTGVTTYPLNACQLCD